VNFHKNKKKLKPNTRKKKEPGSKRENKPKIKMRGNFVQALGFLLLLSVMITVLHRQCCIEASLTHFRRNFAQQKGVMKAFQ
jgi:hypothetical protein